MLFIRLVYSNGQRTLANTELALRIVQENYAILLPLCEFLTFKIKLKDYIKLN